MPGRDNDKNTWEKLIKRAQKGNQSAITELYKRTYPQGIAVALQMVKNEDDAMDIIQNAYVSAFSNLHTVREPEKFKNWFNCIVANKCRDFLRKNREVVFSEIEIEGETPYVETLESDLLQFSPERSLDYSETKKLMNEILETLPSEQRLCIVMYYYNQLSVKEIAETFQCSENTVKSRLSYGKNKIKEGVQALEKKGVKLYNIAPIPFIVWMLQETEKTMAKQSKLKVLLNALRLGIKINKVKTVVTTLALSLAVVGGITIPIIKNEHSKTEPEGNKTELEVVQKEGESIQDYLEKNWKYVGDEILYGDFRVNTFASPSIYYEQELSEGYWSYDEQDYDQDGELECIVLTTNRGAEGQNVVALNMLEKDDEGWKIADTYHISNENWLYYSLEEIKEENPSGKETKNCRIDIMHDLKFVTTDLDGMKCIVMEDATMLPKTSSPEREWEPYYTRCGQIFVYQDEEITLKEEYKFTKQEEIEQWNTKITNSRHVELGKLVVESVRGISSSAMQGEAFWFRYPCSRSVKEGWFVEEKIDYYKIYGNVLKEYQQTDEMDFYTEYHLYDVDKNGVLELFVCDAIYKNHEAYYQIYTIDSAEQVKYLGQINAWNSTLIMDEQGGKQNYMYLIAGYRGEDSGYMTLEKIQIIDGELVLENQSLTVAEYTESQRLYSYYIGTKGTNDFSLLHNKSIYTYEDEIGISTIKKY